MIPHFELTTEAYVIEKLTGQLPTCSLAKYANTDALELPLIDFKYALMGLILSGDLYLQIMLSGSRKDSKKPLIAQRTVFGWVVAGKMSQLNSFPFRSKSPTDLSLCPSRRGALAENMKFDCSRAPRLKPNRRK